MATEQLGVLHFKTQQQEIVPVVVAVWGSEVNLTTGQVIRGTTVLIYCVLKQSVCRLRCHCHSKIVDISSLAWQQ